MSPDYAAFRRVRGTGADIGSAGKCCQARRRPRPISAARSDRRRGCRAAESPAFCRRPAVGAWISGSTFGRTQHAVAAGKLVAEVRAAAGGCARRRRCPAVCVGGCSRREMAPGRAGFRIGRRRGGVCVAAAAAASSRPTATLIRPQRIMRGLPDCVSGITAAQPDQVPPVRRGRVSCLPKRISEKCPSGGIGRRSIRRTPARVGPVASAAPRETPAASRAGAPPARTPARTPGAARSRRRCG